MGALQQGNHNGGQNRGAGTGGLKKQQMRAELAVKEQGKQWHCSPGNKKKEVDHERGYINTNPNPYHCSNSILLPLVQFTRRCLTWHNL
jgi:hypothetical protein